jgi:hypothetical protein
MTEIINCPHCSRKLNVPLELLGQTVQCPTCAATFMATLGKQGSFSLTQPAAPTPPPVPPNPHLAYSAPPPERTSGGGDRRYYTDYYDDVDGHDGNEDETDDYAPRRFRRRDLLPHRGDVILILGYLSLGGLLLAFSCFGLVSLILGISAWIMGSHDLAEMRAGRMDPDGRSSTKVGRTCGIIATVITALGAAAAVVVYFILAL